MLGRPFGIFRPTVAFEKAAQSATNKEEPGNRVVVMEVRMLLPNFHRRQMVIAIWLFMDRELVKELETSCKGSWRLNCSAWSLIEPYVWYGQTSCRPLNTRNWISSALCARAPEWETSYTFVMWNFLSGQVNECKVAGILSSNENVVVGYRGNTYLGWRSEVPSSFFHQRYRPKKELLQSLAYKPHKAPQVMVHLRSPNPSESND